MRARWAPLLALVAAAGLAAQNGISYGQLRQFIRASVDQGLKDKEVANYLRRQVVRFRVDEALVDEFAGWGVGPRTLKALEKLRAATAGFAEPAGVPAATQALRQLPPPSAGEQGRIVETARRLAQAYSEDLPNFVCLQLTRRFYYDATRKELLWPGKELLWRLRDEIKTRVRYVDGHEEYEMLSVNDIATAKGFSDLGGTASTGEFGTLLKNVFAARTAAEFHWSHHSLLRGHPVHVFHVRVPKSRSHWSLTSRDRPNRERLRTIRSGYTGLVYIDKESGRALRIGIEAEGIPASFPVDEARSRLDFDFIEISGQSYLLPLMAQAFIRQGLRLSRNELEFRLYRKFTAETTISFGDTEGPEPLPADEPQE